MSSVTATQFGYYSVKAAIAMFKWKEVKDRDKKIFFVKFWLRRNIMEKK
jgi:hypothetical protein